jgi:hypothetical protein
VCAHSVKITELPRAATTRRYNAIRNTKERNAIALPPSLQTRVLSIFSQLLLGTDKESDKMYSG